MSVFLPIFELKTKFTPSQSGYYPYSVRNALLEKQKPENSLGKLLRTDRALENQMAKAIYAHPKLDRKIKTLSGKISESALDIHKNQWDGTKHKFYYLSRFSTENLLHELPHFQQSIFANDLPFNLKKHYLEAMIYQIFRKGIIFKVLKKFLIFFISMKPIERTEEIETSIKIEVAKAFNQQITSPEDDG